MIQSLLNGLHFYIANEDLSIIENLAQVGVLVRESIAEKLNSIDSSKLFSEEICEKMTGSKVNKQLKGDK